MTISIDKGKALENSTLFHDKTLVIEGNFLKRL